MVRLDRAGSTGSSGDRIERRNEMNVTSRWRAGVRSGME